MWIPVLWYRGELTGQLGIAVIYYGYDEYRPMPELMLCIQIRRYSHLATHALNPPYPTVNIARHFALDIYVVMIK
jgi:hypothetical protein